MIGQDLVTSIFALYNVTSWTTFLSYTIYAFSETIFRILSRCPRLSGPTFIHSQTDTDDFL